MNSPKVVETRNVSKPSCTFTDDGHVKEAWTGLSVRLDGETRFLRLYEVVRDGRLRYYVKHRVGRALFIEKSQIAALENR